MTRTAVQVQLDELARLKKERGPALNPRPRLSAASPSDRKAVGSIEAVGIARQRHPNPKRRTLALPVRTEDLKTLLLALRKDRSFKNRHALADWVMTLLLQLPSKAHELPAEGLAELFQRMREWLRSRGVSG